VLSRFPVFSHTFTSNEMAAVAAEGVEVFVASIWKPLPGHEEEVQAVDQPFLSKIVRPDLRSARTWIGALKGLVRRPQTVGLVIRLIAGHLKSIYQPPKLLASIPKGYYLGQWCRDNKIDQIHAHFLTSPTTVALIASAVSGVPYSYTAHAFDITSNSPRNINGSVPLKGQRAALGVTISNYNRRYLLEHHPALHDARLEVIYNGIDMNLFKAPETSQPPHTNGDPWRVMSVSRLQAKKGYDYLIGAIIALRERGVNVRLDIFGDGPERGTLQQLIDQREMQKHITLHGSIRQEDLACEFTQADLFALASVPLPWGDADGLPTVLIEALAVGLPTVSTQVTGIPEIIQHGVTGLCVPPRDVPQLADAIQWLIEHPNEAHDMGQHGRDLVLERFDRRKNAGHLLALWREIHANGARN
jgi:glycosyltransferase involved in cell wall biosynthesis